MRNDSLLGVYNLKGMASYSWEVTTHPEHVETPAAPASAMG